MTVQCWVSALPTAHYADISASLSCRKVQGWKPYSRKYRPLIANNAASRSQRTENGCTAHSTVPKKLAVSRPQQGCVSTGRNNNRCNAFALGKPYGTRLFRGHFCTGRVFIPYVRFQTHKWLHHAGTCDIMKSPQMSRKSERSAS